MTWRVTNSGKDTTPVLTWLLIPEWTLHGSSRRVAPPHLTNWRDRTQRAARELCRQLSLAWSNEPKD